MSAHSIVVPIGKHTQETRLQIKRHIPNFIQKKGAAFGLLEPAATCTLGASKRTAFVAKELRLQQVTRNCCRVKRNKCHLGSRAMTMKRPCHQFFTRARLACNEHRGTRLTKAADRAKHVLHDRCLAEQLWKRLHGYPSPMSGRWRSIGQRAADQGDGSVYIKRLGEILKGTALKGGHCTV